VKVPSKLTVAATALALGLAPAAALAQSGPNHGKSTSAPGHNRTSMSTTSSGTTPAQAKAYGRDCKGEKSLPRVAGQKGTPFSNCVKDMAELAKKSKMNPHRLCATNESKKHVKGHKGTPYSECVVAAAHLRKHHNKSSTTSSTSSTGTSTSTSTTSTTPSGS
jgi:hypothetical protein